MECNIRYLEAKDGVEYWCLSHKTKATSINGKKPICCDCKYKEKYENIVEMKTEHIKSIKIVYPNLNKNTNVQVFINNQEFACILKIKDSIIDVKDYGGLLLSKLNKIDLKNSKCPYCGGMHTDNGVFAYTPHSKHLCIYCGRFYKVEEANVGNELTLYFDFPDIDLEDNTVLIDEKCKLTYDLFTGDLLINNISCQNIKQNNKTIHMVSFLNEALKNEY